LITHDQNIRLDACIETAWKVLFERILSGMQIINKESSLQLHLSKLIFDLGNIYCILPGERFEIEMETNYENKNIDIVCRLGDARAAIELKCFMTSSNRAKDLDMYDALKDVERLESFEGFQIRKFICLTDNKYYPYTIQKGYASTVSLKHGTVYSAGKEIIPGWANRWKVKRDKPIRFNTDVTCNWVSNDKWHFLKLDVVDHASES
jgi:hypothetical protein